VSGIPIDTQNTFTLLINQQVVGGPVELGVVRNGSLQSVSVTLAQLLSPVIITPSAEITVSDNTRLVVDIGFNGVTGILVLEDQARVREPISDSIVNVPAGSAVIVVPGYAITNPFQVASDQSNRWWEGIQGPAPTVTPVTPSLPIPSLPQEWILALCLSGLCIGIVVAAIIVFVVVMRRRQK
jgi:hypothetical protein